MASEDLGDDEAARNFRRATQDQESRLLALEIALDTIGPGGDWTRKLAGAERFKPTFLAAPDTVHQARAGAELRGLLGSKV